MSRTRLLIIAFILVFILTATGAGLMLLNPIFDFSSVQDFIGAALPEEAANIQWATDDRFTRIIWLRFDVPADTNLSVFYGEMGLTGDPREAFTPFPQANPVEAELTWWLPYEAALYSGQYTNSGTKIHEILLDEDDPARFTIYVRVYAL